MMSSGIESVAMDDQYPEVLVVTDLNGTRRHYLERDGLWIPGRVWHATGPDATRVVLFLPFLDGTPAVLRVERH